MAPVLRKAHSSQVSEHLLSTAALRGPHVPAPSELGLLGPASPHPLQCQAWARPTGSHSSCLTQGLAQVLRPPLSVPWDWAQPKEAKPQK